jgi:hypothetical protein
MPYMMWLTRATPSSTQNKEPHLVMDENLEAMAAKARTVLTHKVGFLPS